MEALLFLFFLAFLSLFLYHTFLKPSSNGGFHLPPGPKPWPIIGNLLQLGKRPHAALANMALTYGPLISLRLGTQLVVVASSPAAAEEILKTHDRDLSARYVPQMYRINNYIEYAFALSYDCNEWWKFLRTICRSELFTAKMLNLHADLREKKIDELVGSLIEREGEVVKIAEEVYATGFNILGNVIFSRDVVHVGDGKNDASGVKQQMSSILQLGTVPNLGDLYPSLNWMDIQGLNGQSKALMRGMYEIWDKLIQERKERNQGKVTSDDFLDVLMNAGCSHLQLRALITDLFIGGAHSTTNVFDWTMSELLRNPQEMRKVKEELKVVVGERRRDRKNPVKESHLSHLTYLECCIKESLRLHPPGPLLLTRQALSTCKVMNYTIPKGCKLMVNVWAIGRDSKIWEDPLTFKPERFVNSTQDYKGNDFELLPFGAGRRICPGIPLANRVVKLVLASLIHTFDWSLPNGMQYNEISMDEKFGISVEREKPLVIVPKVSHTE